MPRKPVSLLISLVITALLPPVSGALSTTNSDNADLILADMALSRGDCRGGTDRYVKADAPVDEIAAGQPADLVLLDKNRKVERRMVDGKWVL